MEHYLHKVSAIYPDRAAAQQARELLHREGFAQEQLRVIGPHDLEIDKKLEPEGNEIPKEITKDAAIGTAIGGLAGLLGSVALGAAGVALFVSSPLVATALLAGYGATVGGIAGTIKGVRVKETAFLGIVEDALKQGHWVLLVHARDAQEDARARALVGETVTPAQTHD
ncbi:MAG: hypothetical protein M3Z21_17330 [Pseudomonadota bacterium]|nr:hypothetical protein [Pseudomonadota bacterium]